MSLSLDSPTYLSSLQNNIRARPIPWEGAVRAGNITEDQLRKIKAVDKVRRDARCRTIQGNEGVYACLLAGHDGAEAEGRGSDGDGDGRSVLETASRRTDIIQYILVLAADLIHDVPSLRHTLATRANRYQHFLPLLAHSTNPEDPIPLLTAAFLTELVSASLVESPSSLPSPSSSSSSKHSSQDDAALPQLYTYLSTLARSHDAGLQDIGIRGFSTLLRTSRSRQIFWAQRRETVAPLVALLRTAAGTGGTGPLSSSNTSSSSSSSTTTSSAAALRDGGGPISNRTNEATGTNGANAIGVGIAVQLLYHVLLVIWQLTFEAGLVGEQLESDYDIIALYIALLRISPKEKTTRLILATLHNLFSAHRDLLLPGAVFNRLPALLATIKARHLTDPDLQADLAALIDMLAEYTAKQTTFTQYAAEVRSGHLHWSPPHRSPQFWRENARRILDADQGALPRKLAEILARDWESDKAVLEIACNDVGCLVKEAPEKRGQLEKLGIKARVMQLMSDPDPAVRWESLKATGEWLRYSIEA